MTFEDFNKNISKIKNIPLPGQASQFKLSPPFREDLIEKYREDIPNAKKAGVLALFYPNLSGICKLALILRKTYNGVHSAQVGLPGGRVEAEDSSIEFTALRETEEEIGISINAISVITEMTEIYIPPSNFLVCPFIGTTALTPVFILQEDEVESVIEVDLEEFMDDNSISDVKVMTSLRKELEVPALNLAGHIVWGATAMMLSEIKDLLKESF